MPKFTSNLLPLSALTHEQQLNNYRLYSIPLRLFLSSLAESASVNVSFTATLRNTVDGGGGCCCVDWAGFEDWLRRRGLSEKHVRHCLSYGKRYVDFLLGKRNLCEVEGLPGKRKILAALSNLARFLGIYGKWRSMLHDAGVSWNSNGNGEWVFKRIYDGETEGLSSWLMKLREKAEDWLWDYVLFLGLSGLRPSEAITALNLVKEGKLRSYMNEETYVLEHFKYPRLFFRNGKKCYVTVLTERMIRLLEKWETVGRRLTYGVVRGKIERAGLNMRLYHLRKNYATFLWKNGVPVEIVDLLQGRCGASVFAKHYFRPMFHEEAEKVRKAVKELEKQLML